MVQWALAYLGGAWLVLQVLDVFAEPWNVPAAVQRLVGVLLGMGFLATLVLSWFHGERGRQRISGTELLVLGALLAITGYLVSRLDRVGEHAPAVASVAPQGTVAVLPFLDLSPGRDHAYFGDGIAEEIISTLTRDGRLRVAARTSTFAMRERPIADIGATLNVASVLEGSVRTDGDTVRITAKLVNVADGFPLWSRSFDRSLERVLQVQVEISHAVLEELTGSAPQAAATAALIDPEAYDLYLQGRFAWNRRTERDLRRATELFERALALEPSYARALSGLADSYAVLGFYEYIPANEAFPRARSLAQRALEADPRLGDAYATLAYVELYNTWDWEAAERAFQSSIDLNPQYPVAHQWYGNLLVVLGRHDEAVRQVRTASELDPLSMIARAVLPWAYHYHRDYQPALELFDQLLSLEERFMLGHYWRGGTRLRAGDVDGAIESFARAVELSDSSAITVAGLARGFAEAGRVDEARRLLTLLDDPTRVPNPPSYEIGKAYLALGDTEEAFRRFERALRDRAPQLVFIGVDPDVDGIRADPRFVRLRQRVGLN